MLALTIGAASSSSIGWMIPSRSRLQTSATSPGPSTSSRSTANSSPPSRPAVSPGRMIVRMRSAMILQRPVALRVPEAIVQVLEVVEVDEQHRGVVRAAAAQPGECVVDVVLQPVPVREPGQRVAVGELAQLVVQPCVVERRGRLANEQLGELHVAVAERMRSLRAELDDPDGLAAHDEREHHEALVADALHVLDLGRVGGRVVVDDDERLVGAQDLAGRRETRPSSYAGSRSATRSSG